MTPSAEIEPGPLGGRQVLSPLGQPCHQIISLSYWWLVETTLWQLSCYSSKSDSIEPWYTRAVLLAIFPLTFVLRWQWVIQLFVFPTGRQSCATEAPSLLGPFSWKCESSVKSAHGGTIWERSASPVEWIIISLTASTSVVDIVEGARPKILSNMRGRGNYLSRLAPSGSLLWVFFSITLPDYSCKSGRKSRSDCSLCPTHPQDDSRDILWIDWFAWHLNWFAWQYMMVSWSVTQITSKPNSSNQRTLRYFVAPQPSSMNTRRKRKEKKRQSIID